MHDVGLRERKKERTRNDLATIALRLFVEQGFDATTIEQIATAADVSTRTFFRYFPTKEDVLFGEHNGESDQRMDMVITGMRNRPAGQSDVQAMRDVLTALTSDYEDDLEVLLARKTVIAATPALRTRALERRELWEASIIDELLRRRPSRIVALRARVTVAASMSALSAAIDTWLDSGGRADLRQLIGQAFDHLTAGLDDREHP